MISCVIYVPGQYVAVDRVGITIPVGRMGMQVVQDGLRRDVSQLHFYMLSRARKTDVREKIKEKGEDQNIMFVHK